jgi:hypothetical protein
MLTCLALRLHHGVFSVAGNYFLDISGIGGGTSGYGGNIATFAVPGPVVGAGLPGLLGLLGFGFLALKRRLAACRT